MSNFRMRTSNATLSFRANGHTNTAKVRVSRTTYQYGVNSTESHARLDRAFYPHRRALGRFQVTVDCIGYGEYRQFMNWLREYAQAMFRGQAGNQRGAATMEVQMSSRNFHMIGILVSGIGDNDHVGSMVFRPVLSFMLLKDFNDKGTSISKLSNVSEFIRPRISPQLTTAFYPVTVNSYKDADTNIYDNPDPGTSTNQDPTPNPVLPPPISPRAQ